MHRELAADTLDANEIGRVVLRRTEPVFVDDYRRNRATGSFVLIDEATHQTVARRHDPRSTGRRPTPR